MFREEIYHLIRNDWQLRQTLADVLGISEGSIYTYAKRKAPKLEHYLVVKQLMLYTGKSDTEVFKISISNK